MKRAARKAARPLDDKTKPKKSPPRILNAEEFATRVVWTGPPPRHAPFVCDDGRKICGAKAKSVVGPDGERVRCEATPSGNGRCNGNHSGEETMPGRPTSDAKRSEYLTQWLGFAASVDLKADLLSGVDDLELYERRILALFSELAAAKSARRAEDWKEASRLHGLVMEGSAAGVKALKDLGELLQKGAGIDLLEDRLDNLIDKREKIRRGEARREQARAETMATREVFAYQSRMEAAVDEVVREFGEKLRRFAKQLAMQYPDLPELEFRDADLKRLIYHRFERTLPSPAASTLLVRAG